MINEEFDFTRFPTTAEWRRAIIGFILLALACIVVVVGLGAAIIACVVLS